MTFAVAGYQLQHGSSLDRALLVKFMQQTYSEGFPGTSTAHLAQTVEQYLSKDTPLWWVRVLPVAATEPGQRVGCLWLGTAIDQASGARCAHIFLLYVAVAHRQRGIGRELMQQAEAWAKARGDRQIGLQVFVTNQPALALYESLGYQVQSVTMLKPLSNS